MSGTSKSANISPTAHYTGYVWAHNNLGPKAMATQEGQLFYRVMQPVMAVSDAFGGPTLEGLLLARHAVIDHLLHEAIAAGQVGQIVEIAAGMSPRGHQFATRYGADLTYIEADLPGMARRKRQVLAGLPTGPQHRVVEIDALRESGPQSLTEIASDLDPDRGIAIVTEGLLGYLTPEQVAGLWRQIATVSQRFPNGLYLSDLHVAQHNKSLGVKAFSTLLGLFVRGKTYFHFDDSAEAERALRQAGFASASVHRARAFKDTIAAAASPGARTVHIVEART